MREWYLNAEGSSADKGEVHVGEGHEPESIQASQTVVGTAQSLSNEQVELEVCV